MKAKIRLGKNTESVSTAKQLANEMLRDESRARNNSIENTTQADEIEYLLKGKQQPDINHIPSSSPLSGLDTKLGLYLSSSKELPDYGNMFPMIRIKENSHIQTTGTVTKTSLNKLQCDICKETISKSNHMILCEVCLVPVH